MVSSFADSAIASLHLSGANHVHGRMYSNPKHIKPSQEYGQIVCLSLFLDNVLNQKIEAGERHGWNRAMERVKELLPSR